MFLEKKTNREIRKLADALNKVIGTLHKDIDNLERGIQHVRNKYGNYPDRFIVPNSMLFIRLTFLDIIILSKQFLESRKEFEKLILAKQLSIAIYEMLEDVPSIYGKKYLNAISGIENERELIEGRKKIQKSLILFKNEISEELKTIRNFTAAHKEHDSLKQLEIVRKISLPKIELIIQGVYLLWFQLMDYEKVIRQQIKKTENNP